MHNPSRVRFSGPLVPYADGFRAELARQGYTNTGYARPDGPDRR